MPEFLERVFLNNILFQKSFNKNKKSQKIKKNPLLCITSCPYICILFINSNKIFGQFAEQYIVNIYILNEILSHSLEEMLKC